MDNSTNQVQIPAEVRSFLENLLSEASVSSLDGKMHEGMIQELYVRLDNFIASTIIDNLPPEHLNEFIKLNEENKPQEEIEQFLKGKLPNYNEVFSKAFMQFRDLYLGTNEVAKGPHVS